MSASAASSSSLALVSLTPKTLPLFASKPTSLSLSSSSFSFASLKLYAANGSVVSVSPRGFRGLSSSSRFVRNVAVSSEFEQDEDVLSDEGEGEDFSPDLKLFVGNLPFSVDSAQLAELFERAGNVEMVEHLNIVEMVEHLNNVEMVEVIYDKTTGRSRGFGFVTMSSIGEVEAAAQQFNGYELEGRPLRVNYGPPPPREESSFPRGGRGGGGGGGGFETSNRIYVGNLSWGVDNAALENLFSEQGRVLEAKVVYDRDSGRSRGFGFVTYNTADEVNSAIQSLNGVDLNGRAIRVTHAEAKPRRSNWEQCSCTMWLHQEIAEHTDCDALRAGFSRRFLAMDGRGIEMIFSVLLFLKLKLMSLVDALYNVQILVRFRTACPSSRVLGRGELVIDPSKITSRYLHKDFRLDLVAAQPLPQVCPCRKSVPTSPFFEIGIFGDALTCKDQYRWIATRGVDEKAILRGLLLELWQDIKRHLCLQLVRQS
ncbi:hypothetical protein TIFTF001_008393 [Ficus carica]|uniref:RRM domain-containing protein n=1 Tax=Ficus carica TaxID=3494 RepID=A0AA88CXX2_FICCA|nr:hypothetical protein TIFTF001_008393 [Ficus carica]